MCRILRDISDLDNISSGYSRRHFRHISGHRAGWQSLRQCCICTRVRSFLVIRSQFTRPEALAGFRRGSQGRHLMQKVIAERLAAMPSIGFSIEGPGRLRRSRARKPQFPSVANLIQLAANALVARPMGGSRALLAAARRGTALRRQAGGAHDGGAEARAGDVTAARSSRVGPAFRGCAVCGRPSGRQSHRPTPTLSQRTTLARKQHSRWKRSPATIRAQDAAHWALHTL